MVFPHVDLRTQELLKAASTGEAAAATVLKTSIGLGADYDEGRGRTPAVNIEHHFLRTRNISAENQKMNTKAGMTSVDQCHDFHFLTSQLIHSIFASAWKCY